MPEIHQAGELPGLLAFGTHCPATDPIGMEFALEEGDPALRRQLIAVQLQTAAAVYRELANGAAKLAEIHGAGGA
jgi:hypothetical protein